ncbi:MAG: glycosyltransferase [Deltaproteobacteria bacterium]|nr:glycosyltransferase [Deltaproteobacteria bacterium]
MRCPDLQDLPPHPPGRNGWPWDIEPIPSSTQFANNDPLPKISIVTPSFNQGGFLEETIRSVLLQGYPELEYIVIDGGSTDDSVEIIKKYSPWLHYWISEPDKGQSSAINKGFQMATGSLYAYINSDDLYEPCAFLSAATEFMKPERPQLLAGDCIIFDESVVKRTFKAWWPEEIGHLLKPFGSTFPQPAAFWSRDIYFQVGGFDENSHYVFDREFFLKIGLTGKAPLIVGKPLARYRDHADTKTAQTVRFYQESLPVIEKYADQCGLTNQDKQALMRICQDEIGYLSVFIRWKQAGRAAGLAEFCRLLLRSPWLVTERKIMGQFRRLLFFREQGVEELRHV